MGLLDMFDNPAVLQSLFGIGGDAGASPQMPMPPGGGVPNQPQMVQAPMPPPRPPEPQLGAPSMDEAGMQGVPQGVPLPPPAPNANFDQRFAAANPPLPPGGPSIPPSGGIGSDAARTPRVPVPTWAPGTEANAGPGGPGAPVDGSRPGARAPMPPPPGGPVPPGGPQPEMPAPNGGLPGAFGVNQQPSRADALRAALGGLGKGLSNVGKLPAGASKGQSFAAGLGGSLEGTTEAQQKQKDTLFNQTSTAFRDMLAAQGSEDVAGYRAAQSKYLAARAKSLEEMTKAGRVSGAYQNSPEYKVLRVEQQVDKWRDSELKALREQWKADGTSKEDRAADTAALEKRAQQKLNELYKRTGIDPLNAEKIKTMGIAPDNPFDTKGMTKDEFEARVPKGGYYRNTDGKVYRRTSDPAPGHKGEVPQTTAAASPEDDRAALTDRAA